MSRNLYLFLLPAVLLVCLCQTARAGVISADLSLLSVSVGESSPNTEEDSQELELSLELAHGNSSGMGTSPTSSTVSVNFWALIVNAHTPTISLLLHTLAVQDATLPQDPVLGVLLRPA